MTSNASSRRHVSIHLTPFAPGVSQAAIGDRRRWIALWSVTPAQAMTGVVDRLGRAPRALSVRMHAGDLEVLGRVDGHPDPVPLALIPDGLTAAEAAQGLAALTNGVRP